MSVKDAVAQRFLDICRERNMKINELADRSGVTPSTAYSMVDKSRRNISITTIKKILRRPGYVPGRILLGTDL